MTKRRQKVLSLVLASSMVFSMNAVSFAAEEIGEAAEADVMKAYEVLETAGSEDVAEVTEVAGAEGTAQVAEATATIQTTSEGPSIGGDPISWNIIDNPDVLGPLFMFHATGSKSDHVANGKGYTVSYNNGEQGVWGVLLGGYDSDHDDYEFDGVSSNVFKVMSGSGKNATDDGVRLIVLYRLYDGDLYDYYYDYDRFDIGGTPYVTFDGRKVGTKWSAKERGAIEVEAALVKYDDTKKTVELIANSGSMNGTGPKAKYMLEFPVTAKNNQFATVSADGTVYDAEGNELGEKAIDIRSDNKNIKKATDHPFFTIKVKVNDDKAGTLKAYKSQIAKAVGTDGTTLITNWEFPFEIKRAEFAGFIISQKDKVSENVANGRTDRWYWLGLETAKDTVAVKIKGSDGDIKVQTTGGNLYKYDKKKGYYVDTGKDWTYKLSKAGTGDTASKKGDYTTKVMDDPSGSSSGILILKPCGNYEGDSAAFRTVKYTDENGVEVTETRSGVYRSDDMYFVWSEK